jgi:hypothetical protein
MSVIGRRPRERSSIPVKRGHPTICPSRPGAIGRDLGKRQKARIRISGLPAISISGGVSPDTPISWSSIESWVVFGCGRARFRRTCQAIAPKSTHHFRPLKSKPAPRSQRGMRGRGLNTVSWFAITSNRGGVCVGRCASRRFSAPRPSKRSTGA